MEVRGAVTCAKRPSMRIRHCAAEDNMCKTCSKDDLEFVYDTRVGANDGADGEEKVLTAFFRAPIPIVSVSCAGDKIAVGCQSGAVLTLHAAWLTDGGAVVEEVEDEEEQLDEVVMKAFESLPEGGEGTGLSVVDIARRCSQQMGREIPKTAVMKVVDKMCLEGITYWTINEEHYAKI